MTEMLYLLEPYFRWTRGKRLLWRVNRYLHQERLAARARAAARDLAGHSGFKFTADYFSPHVERWSHVLAGLRGRAGLQALEIGTDEGRSAVWLLANVVTGPGSRLTCLDLFGEPDRELRFEHNVRVAGAGGRVRKLKGRSEDLLPSLPPEAFDFIYVDAAHDAPHALFDGLQAWRALKPGGILILDDYEWGRELRVGDRPQPAIDLMLLTLGPAAEVLHHGSQVMLRKPA